MSRAEQLIADALVDRSESVDVTAPAFEAILARADGQPPAPPVAGSLPLASGGLPSATATVSGADVIRISSRRGTSGGAVRSVSTSGGRALRRGVAIVAVVSVLAVVAGAVWFFWHGVRCLGSSDPDCDPTSVASLEVAADEMLAAVQEGDVRAVQLRLPGRCGLGDDEVAELLAGAPSPITRGEATVFGRGGTVRVTSGGSTQTSVWLYVDGRWQLEFCRTLDELLGE